MLSNRSRTSLAQLLELYDAQFSIVLLTKHGLWLSIDEGALLASLTAALRNQALSSCVTAVLEEVIRTQDDLRRRISPRYRFDDRFGDLSRCLQLDGFKVDGKQLVPLDPSILDSPPIEDELLEALSDSGLDHDAAIRQKLVDSAEAFRRVPPNYNACMNDGRVALETIARRIAENRARSSETSFDTTKWGAILTFLRLSGFFTAEEEQGLAGVYKFLSPGSHRPVGLTEAEMTRLGRAIALSMCWFLIKIHTGNKP